MTERHEALRTVFPSRGSTPIQVVLPAAPPAGLVRLGLAGAVPGAGQEIEDEAEALWRQPIDLVNGPIARATVLAGPDGARWRSSSPSTTSSATAGPCG